MAEGFYLKTKTGIEVIVPIQPDTYPKEIKPATDLSEWITRDGGIYYYIKRDEDYLKRYHWREKSPYYLEYGHKYMTRFNELKPKFSPIGQQWVTITSHLLRQYMEEGLRQDNFQKEVWLYKEYNEEKFLDFAFGTHADAYMNGGMYELIWENSNETDRNNDIKLLISILDSKDILGKRGVLEILKILKQCATKYKNAKLRPVNEILHNEMMRLVNEILKYKGFAL